jgi:hypothetical protein
MVSACTSYNQPAIVPSKVNCHGGGLWGAQLRGSEDMLPQNKIAFSKTQKSVDVRVFRFH